MVDEEVALTTLGAKSLIKQDFDDSPQEEVFVTSLVGSWALRDLTAATNVGPIMVGVAHSDYSAAEIEEFIENANSWKIGNQISQEQAKRKIRIVGIMRNTVDAQDSMTLQNGRMIKTKINWTLISGATIALWGYNLGSAAVATTVPDLFLNGHVNMFRT